MHAIHQAAGRAIDEHRVALAEAVVARQYSLRPELVSRYGPDGRARCLQDTEHHLANLSAAVAASSPALFVDYLEWARSVLAASDVRDEDVEGNLASLQEVLAAALTGEHAEITGRFLKEAIQCSRSPARFPPFLISGDEPLAALAGDYLRALLGYDRREATRQILDAVASGVPVADIYLHVFQPCQREVGRLWQARQVSVAQEHFGTAVTQSLMARLTPEAGPDRRIDRRVVAASVGDERHEVGLRVVTDFFEMSGYETLFLGAGTPAPDLARTVADRRPDLLLISATMVAHLPGVGALIAAVRDREECRGVTILVGGHPFDVVPDLWRQSGADGYAADAKGALVEAERLLAARSVGEQADTPS
ncbi:cobalamin-dependent protein [Isosphaeraceae bacterium EP7]